MRFVKRYTNGGTGDPQTFAEAFRDDDHTDSCRDYALAKLVEANQEGRALTGDELCEILNFEQNFFAGDWEVHVPHELDLDRVLAKRGHR